MAADITVYSEGAPTPAKMRQRAGQSGRSTESLKVSKQVHSHLYTHAEAPP